MKLDLPAPAFFFKAAYGGSQTVQESKQHHGRNLEDVDAGGAEVPEAPEKLEQVFAGTQFKDGLEVKSSLEPNQVGQRSEREEVLAVA